MRHRLSPLSLAPVVAVAAIVAACASTPRFEGEGGDARFYAARCGVCHVPWPRESHDAAEWPKILDVMAPRAGLTSVQRERVLGYVTTR
jgi:hypothetical protein